MRPAPLLMLLAAVLSFLAGSSASTGPALAAPCDPIQTPPTFRGQVPTAEQELGFALGSQEVTAAESDKYVEAVDASSAGSSAALGTSWEGRPPVHARRQAREPDARWPRGDPQATARLRDPETPPAEAARLAAETPVILWLMGNVHGGEESGTDAELRVLYELADRDRLRCAADPR